MRSACPDLRTDGFFGVVLWQLAEQTEEMWIMHVAIGFGRLLVYNTLRYSVV